MSKHFCFFTLPATEQATLNKAKQMDLFLGILRFCGVHRISRINKRKIPVPLSNNGTLRREEPLQQQLSFFELATCE